MAQVGTGTGHQNQMDALDAEIAAMEAQVTGNAAPQSQQTPEQVATNLLPEGVVPDENGMVEAITSIEEFEAAESGQTQQQPGDEVETTEVAPQPQMHQEEESTVPEPQQQTSGRRSWKSDYLELENRYVKLRQASDHYKFESKQQIAALQQKLADSYEQLEAFRQQLSTIQQEQQQNSIAGVFSQEDIDVLGEGTITNFQKAINQAVEAATNPLQTELLQMKKAERERLKQQAQTNANVAYQTFEGRLAQLVPDYAIINVNPEFVKWLNQPSTYGGGPRMTFFRNAESNGDVERVAQFFVEFKQLTEAPQQMLEQSVMPTGQGGGGAAPAQVNAPPANQPRVFTKQFINQFYDDDIAGKYKGKEALRDKLDQEIDLALAEGRVV